LFEDNDGGRANVNGSLPIGRDDMRVTGAYDDEVTADPAATGGVIIRCGNGGDVAGDDDETVDGNDDGAADNYSTI
jgi:hypothetical protein